MDIEAELQVIMENLRAKQVNISSYESWNQHTFLAFDSYNLGLKQARDEIGMLLTRIDVERVSQDKK